MARADRATWEKRVERWKDSDLTAEEFAKEIGVSANALTQWWKWRLGKKDAPAGTPKRQRRVRKPAVSPITFVEMAAAARNDLLEIVFPSGVRVRVPTAVDAVALARVVDVLEKHR